MPKINVYLPDDLADAVKGAELPVSAICQRALEQAVRRVAAIREIALADLDAAPLPPSLQRLTARAHGIVRRAVDQARAEGREEVGTGSVLAAILAEGNSLALAVLRAMEISPEQVQGSLRREQPAPDGAAADALAFSGSAAAALELAVGEALSLGHNYVGSEHLLLGLVSEPEGTAGQVLRSLGADPRLTRRAVSATLAGYVYLKSQQAGAAAPGESGAADSPALPPALAEAVDQHLHQHLQALTERVGRLEARIAASGE